MPATSYGGVFIFFSLKNVIYFTQFKWKIQIITHRNNSR